MRVVRINKFIQEDDHVNWLIDGLLPDVGWTLFYGTQGLGKTTFAMQMCSAMQAGLSFLERKTIKTSTLYIQSDSTVIEWREMLRRIAPKSDGFTAVEVPGRCLGTPEYVSRLINYVETFKPGYIVFDSLYKLTAWPINTDNGIASALDRLLSIAQATPWMLIHHPPHSELRAAGHNSIAAACSNEWGLSATQLKINKGRLVKKGAISLQKDKDGLWSLHKIDIGLSNESGFFTKIGG